MAKMYIMQGLPASGKSTRAKEIIAKDGNTVRINKDLIRKMLHFGKFTGRNEGLTRDAARRLTITFLQSGVNVIIDDTNLNEGTLQSWVDIAKELDAKIEHVKMDTDMYECMRRDRDRADSVGWTVIANMALAAGMYAPTKGLVICDIDGTLAGIEHRLHYVRVPEGQKKDWKSFFSELDKDTVRQDVAAMLEEYHRNGYAVVFVSGRPDTYKEQTLKWLETVTDECLPLGFVSLIMRQAHDKRPDTETKADIYDKYLAKYPIHAVLDDRPSVIRMWREKGLNVIDVGKGVEF